MKSKWVTCLLLVLVAVAIRLPAQQSDVARKKFDEIKAKAETGDALAEYSLGYCYEKGVGVAKDAVEAVTWYRKAAEQNDAAGQYNLGVCYRDGQGVTKDEIEAVNWFRKAAEQNLAMAQYNLGVCYGSGQGVVKDYVEAAKWYRKAAGQDLAYAQCNLGAFYEHGIGVVKDDVEAVKLYRKAAEQNYATAQYNLGACYANGQGVAKDEVEAVKWYRKAADQNLAAAQYNLAVCYYNGQGVTQNMLEAYIWLSLSAKQGDKAASQARDSAASQLSRAEISEGQRRITAFVPHGEIEGTTGVNPLMSASPPKTSFSIEQQEPPVAPVVKKQTDATVVPTPKNVTRRPLTKEELQKAAQMGYDVSAYDGRAVDIPNSEPATPTPPDLKGATIWMDSFLGITNARIVADIISMKPEELNFRLLDKDYKYSGHYTLVMLNPPRQHKNPYLGLGSPETAKLVILENVGGIAYPLENATIWEKSKGFIVVTAFGKEWIYFGNYTIQN